MPQQIEREAFEVITVNSECRVITSENLRVVYEPASYLPEVVRRRYGLRDSSHVLELHFPNIIQAPVDALTPEHKTGSFRQFFEWLAQNSNSLFPLWEAIVGITNRGMAGGAKLLGFDIAEIEESDIDPGRLEKIRQGYEQTRRFQEKGLPMGGIFVCYYPFERFIARFNGHRS